MVVSCAATPLTLRVASGADDSELDPAVQQVLEIQLQAGQEQEQLNTQEFQERFFLNI